MKSKVGQRRPLRFMAMFVGHLAAVCGKAIAILSNQKAHCVLLRLRLHGFCIPGYEVDDVQRNQFRDQQRHRVSDRGGHIKWSVVNVLRVIWWSVLSLVGYYDYGEFAVRSWPEDSAESKRRTSKMFEIEAEVQKWVFGASTPIMFVRAGSHRRKTLTSAEENAYVTANYVHFMSDRMKDFSSYQRMFTAEPPKVPRCIGAIWAFRQKVICFWRYELAKCSREIVHTNALRPTNDRHNRAGEKDEE